MTQNLPGTRFVRVVLASCAVLAMACWVQSLRQLGNSEPAPLAYEQLIADFTPTPRGFFANDRAAWRLWSPASSSFLGTVWDLSLVSLAAGTAWRPMLAVSSALKGLSLAHLTPSACIADQVMTAAREHPGDDGATANAELRDIVRTLTPVITRTSW
jgi:hypothetical protein